MRFGRLSFRRFLAWSAFCLALVGLGGLLYAALPPEPRWTIQDGPKPVMFLAGDVVATADTRDNQARGPVYLWDVTTRQEVARFLTDEPIIAWHELSVDSRWLIAVTERDKKDKRSIRRVDLRERKEAAIEAELGIFNTVQMSPGCQFLAVGTTSPHADFSFVIVDTETGHAVDRFTAPMVDFNDDKVRRPVRADGLFTDDGRWFIISYVQNGTQYTRVSGTRTAESTLLDNAAALGAGPDSQSLVIDRGEDGVWIWDMPAKGWRCQLDGAPIPANVFFSPDRRLVACVPVDNNPPRPLRFFDLTTGALHWEFPAGMYSNVAFSPDGRSFAMNIQVGPMDAKGILCDLHAKRRVWEKTWADDFGVSLQFTPDSRGVIMSGLGRVDLLDAATGETRWTVDAPGMVQPQADLMADGRLLLVEQRPFPGRLSELREWLFPNRARAAFDDPVILYVVDMESGAQLTRLHCDSTGFSVATADCRSLLVFRHERLDEAGVQTTSIIECYDLPPRIAWPWVLGVPPVVGVLLVAMVAGWRVVRWLQKTKNKSGGKAPHAK